MSLVLHANVYACAALFSLTLRCLCCFFISFGSRLLLFRFVSLYAPRFSRNSQEHYVNNKYKNRLAAIAKKNNENSETTKLLTMDV